MLAAAATGSLALAAPAFAHDGHRGHGWGHFRHHDNRHHNNFHPHRPVVVVPPRVVYAPPPRVFYAPPAPVYYAPPPVVYRPAPVYAPAPESSVSIRLHFPL
jgi:hypothetical protein